ncbi:A/G-specific adenine glycosylase [Maribacter algarum]|uniref:Adenine DNA glycosylase n=1 Tax=Maribacter algarum (ex Zhang et al. 2020) TaxID=2578118 RepID=A0A5S3QN14_9FLAO|nr:A/G-specific adenine glycosylase [Maribacter algarum]TMM59294.1 A/G-specific adenine glycosylase [Maribacter algarum]
MTFSQNILIWYAQNKRTLPWRRTRDPYKIWLSEIMLQQTRVVQGTPYYLKFVANFPTVYDLAASSEEEVLKLWQGLGYYSRARNLHATAKMVVEEYEGNFPNTYEGLLKLKGVGDYTASAIASICFDEAQPVVDGNVYRVLARYFGVDIAINSTEGVKYFKELAREVMDTENIRDYNQGIMEFGAIQCAPKKPYCLHCPLNESCVALQGNKIEKLPVKLNKTKVRNRYFNYLVPVIEAKDGDLRTVLAQRKGKGIWQNLWEFPLLECQAEANLEKVKQFLPEILELKDIPEVTPLNEQLIVHKLSHQHLHTRFWKVKTKTDLTNSIPIKNLEDYPVPVLIADFIERLKNSYF